MTSAEGIFQEKRPSTGASWGQERRLEFIEFRLLWEGKINRGELVGFFGTSIQQASLDLGRYMELAPGNMEYDKSEKVYKAKSKLKLIFTRPDSQAFLSQLSGPATDTVPTAFSFIGWRPPYDVVRYPTRSIRPEILMRAIWAIRDREDIELSYQSMRRPIASRRWISPHAIAFDGYRWHARAWCHENKSFKDFVFARIQEIYGFRKSEIDARTDTRWHSFVTIILRAHRDLTAGQRLAVETEFGMLDGTLQVSMREALAFYFVRQLHLDRYAGFPSGAQVIELVNAEDVAPLLIEATSR